MTSSSLRSSNELQARGDKTKLMQLVRSLKHRRTFCAILLSVEQPH